jgi:hypothetical protein
MVVVIVMVMVMGRPLKLAGEICRGVGRVLGDGLALRLLSSGVGEKQQQQTTSREIVFDSASALRASALDTAHVPEYCMRALDVHA